MDGNQRSGGIPEDFFEKSQKANVLRWSVCQRMMVVYVFTDYMSIVVSFSGLYSNFCAWSFLLDKNMDARGKIF